MARIRTIKPQFWEDEKIGRLTFKARLLFIGIWNFADDEGVTIWSAEYLRSRIFPYDDIPLPEVEILQDELVTANFIFSYKYGQDSYGVILNFKKHQVINRPVPSKLPSPNWEDSKYKDAIFKRDHFICAYCGRLCETHCKEDSLTTGLSIDHVLPRSKGGTDYPSNLVTACASCNKSKGNRHKNTHAQLTDLSVSSQGLITDNSMMEKEGKGGEREREKEKESKLYILPDWIDKQTWKDFLEMRKRLRASPTDKAIQLLIKDLENFKAGGDDPNKVLEQSIANSWRGLFPLKDKKGRDAGQSNPRKLPTRYTRPEEL